jgi:hypothetical protein
MFIVISHQGAMLEPEAVHEHAKAEKKKGDEEYLKAAFATAVMHYTRAIALTHGRHPAFIVSLFTNRAAAHIMLKAYTPLLLNQASLSLSLSCSHYLPLIA